MRALLGLLILLLVGFAPAAVLARSPDPGAASVHWERIGDVPASPVDGTRSAEPMPVPGADRVAGAGGGPGSVACRGSSAPCTTALARRARPGRAHVSADPSH